MSKTDAEDVEAQRGSGREMQVEHIELDGFLGINRGDSYGPLNQLGRRWDWIEAHCGRKQDLIPLQRRMMYKAFLALVDENHEEPLLELSSGMRSVRWSLKQQLKQLRSRRWWGLMLQVLGIGRSQQRLLEARLHQIEHLENTMGKVLTKIPPNNGMFREMGLYRKVSLTLEDQGSPTFPAAGEEWEGKLRSDSATAARKHDRKFVMKEIEKLDKLDKLEAPYEKVRYIVVALQPKGSNDPQEKHLRIERDIFKDLRKGINSLRGWRGLFSLKSLKAFGLSKVS